MNILSVLVGRDFLGPSLGGVMVDVAGFEWSMTYVALLCGLMVKESKIVIVPAPVGFYMFLSIVQ